MRLRINKRDLMQACMSLIIILACSNNIAYMNQYINQTLMMYIRYFIIICLFVVCLHNKIKFTDVFKAISLFVISMCFSAITGGRELFLTITMLSSPYLLCLYLEVFKQDKIKILKTWCFFLTILVLLDAFSMVVFPEGLYADALYENNWFLGYKTNRLVYSLPLCVFTMILEHEKLGKAGIKSYFVIILSAICLLYSDATGASIALLLLGLLMVFVDASVRFGNRQLIKKVYRICDYKFLLPMYLLLSLMFFTIEKNEFLQNFIVNVLKKDATLTTRTLIWENCLTKFIEYPLLGLGYVSSDVFIEISKTPFASSAHNMLITILLSGGLVGSLLYCRIVIKSMRTVEQLNILSRLPLLLGIVSSWVVGISSSGIVYSLCGFVFFELLALYSIEKNSIASDGS